jgi:hypothetical protein
MHAPPPLRHPFSLALLLGALIVGALAGCSSAEQPANTSSSSTPSSAPPLPQVPVSMQQESMIRTFKGYLDANVQATTLDLVGEKAELVGQWATNDQVTRQMVIWGNLKTQQLILISAPGFRLHFGAINPKDTRVSACMDMTTSKAKSTITGKVRNTQADPKAAWELSFIQDPQSGKWLVAGVDLNNSKARKSCE